MPEITEPEWLEIGGVPLATPAWGLTDLAPLRDVPEIRGADKLVSHAAGARARRRRATVTKKAFPIWVAGDFDLDGNAIEDPYEGLDANVDYLNANVLGEVDSDEGTRAAVWHRRDGSTRSTDLHVLGPVGWRSSSPFVLVGVLRVSIPSGVFVVDP